MIYVFDIEIQIVNVKISVSYICNKFSMYIFSLFVVGLQRSCKFSIVMVNIHFSQ